MPERRVLSEEEYNQVREQVLASAPPNLDEATFNRWIGPTLTAAIQEAELRPAPQSGSAVGRFASNLGAMLNPVEMVKGAYQAVTNPIDTAQGIVGAMGDQWSQGLDLARQGRYVEGAGHMAAGSVPLLGPVAAQVGEQAAQGDVAGAAGATAGLLTPFGIKPGVQAARSMTPKGLRATIAERLEARAGQRYAGVMAPTVGPNKTRFGTQAEKVGPQLAKNPEMSAWSREGLHANVKQGLDAARQQLDEAADANLATASIETKPLLEALKSERQRLVAGAIDASEPARHVTPRTSSILDDTGRPFQVDELKAQRLGRDVEPAPNSPRIAALDEVIAEVERLGPLARYESLRRIRQAWDSVARQVYMPSPTADLLKLKGHSLGAADATGALRAHLAQASPKMAKANEAFSLYKAADDVLNATAEVERTRPKVGRAIMARMAGAMGGGQAAGPAGVAGGWVLGPVLDAAVASVPTTRLKTAQLMTQLARAVRGGDVDQVNLLLGRLQRTVGASQQAVNVARQPLPASAEHREGRPRERAAR